MPKDLKGISGIFDFWRKSEIRFLPPLVKRAPANYASHHRGFEHQRSRLGDSWKL